MKVLDNLIHLITLKKNNIFYKYQIIEISNNKINNNFIDGNNIKDVSIKILKLLSKNIKNTISIEFKIKDLISNNIYIIQGIKNKKIFIKNTISNNKKIIITKYKYIINIK